MKLKPFRQYDENEVVNLYSLVENSGNAGDLVKLVSMVPTDMDGYVGNIAPFNGMDVPLPVVKSKVALATSGSENAVLGVALWNVSNTDVLGRQLMYDLQRYNELQTVYSGQALPVLVRGMVMVSGFAGTAAPGSGIGVSNTVAGGWKVVDPATDASLGKFMSSTGSDGYALAYINLK